LCVEVRHNRALFWRERTVDRQQFIWHHFLTTSSAHRCCIHHRRVQPLMCDADSRFGAMLGQRLEWSTWERWKWKQFNPGASPRRDRSGSCGVSGRFTHMCCTSVGDCEVLGCEQLGPNWEPRYFRTDHTADGDCICWRLTGNVVERGVSVGGFFPLMRRDIFWGRVLLGL